MQPGTSKLLRFLGNWIINTAAVALTVVILRNHISYGDKWANLVMASFLLGILNAVVKPILQLIALPLVVFSLGLFLLVINALMLCLLSALLPFFHVDTFGYAFLGAACISIITMVLNGLTGNARITVHRRPPPPPPRSGNNKDGNGPVIDV